MRAGTARAPHHSTAAPWTAATSAPTCARTHTRRARRTRRTRRRERTGRCISVTHACSCVGAAWRCTRASVWGMHGSLYAPRAEASDDHVRHADGRVEQFAERHERGLLAEARPQHRHTRAAVLKVLDTVVGPRILPGEAKRVCAHAHAGTNAHATRESTRGPASATQPVTICRREACEGTLAAHQSTSRGHSAYSRWSATRSTRQG